MVKRKRKAPKRRRRKGRFGSVLDTVSTAISPVKEEIAAVIESSVPEGEKLKEKIGKKVSDAKKVNILSTNITQIKQEFIKDIKADKFTFSNIKKYINDKGNIAVESLYSMIDNLGLRDKITKKLGSKALFLKSASGLLPAFYNKLKGAPKLIMNILGNIVFNNPKLLQQKIKNDKNEENYELYILAQETAVQAAKAAAEAAKKAAEEAKKKKEEEAKKAATPATPPAPTTAPAAPAAPAGFGKRKRGPSASLKRMCKKHGVRLMVKRGKKRVYKSSKVLKGECQRKLKNKLKKNFGRKKIKRSGIMPPRKRKTRGKKRRSGTKGKKYPKTFKRLMEKMYRGTQKRGRAAARYARRNPGNVAGGLAGLGALGLGAYEGYSRYKNRGSPIKRAYEGARDYPYRDTAREAFDGVRSYDYRGAPGRAYTGAKTRAGEFYRGAKSRASSGVDYLRNLFKRKPAQPDEKYESLYGKRRRRRSSYKFGAKKEGCGHTGYGKRRRRRKKKKFGGSCPSHSYGKKVSKKPSAATRRLCKKLKVRLTVKRGGKRVYKSEAMLKKQCKKAMKRKSKK